MTYVDNFFSEINNITNIILKKMKETSRWCSKIFYNRKVKLGILVHVQKGREWIDQLSRFDYAKT